PVENRKVMKQERGPDGVDCSVAERQMLGIRDDGHRLEALGLEPALRRLRARMREIDADDAVTTASKPDRVGAGAAPQVEHVALRWRREREVVELIVPERDVLV